MNYDESCKDCDFFILKHTKTRPISCCLCEIRYCMNIISNEILKSIFEFINLCCDKLKRIVDKEE